MALISLLAFAAVVGILAIAKYIESMKKNRLPPGVSKLPGPKGLPFIGNVHELPEKNNWMKFHEWAEEFGPIYQVNLAGTNHVWISRDAVAHELLSKRSGNYSDRPFIPALEHDNRDSGQYLPLMSKNDKWTRQRKFAKQIMDTSAKEDFYGYPELESIRLLFEVITEPSRYNHALESFVARVTCRLGWGTPSAAEELKQRARELLIGVSPTGSFANKLPFIMSLPESWTKSKAWELRRGRTERKFFETMQEDVRQQIKDSEKNYSSPTPTLPSLQRKNSWMRMFLENKQAWKFDSDLEGAYAVGMHGIAGALTVAAPMQSFCLALCHYPQHQQILHEEIDRVLGDRMITFSDMPDMPVLRAFIRETLRWRPPVPTGIPHASVKDDIYDGYHIPAGSVIHPLEWSISRDPEVFYEPDVWNPLRWLDNKYPTYQEPLSQFPTITGYSQFGYGRRTCQGMGVTEADLFVGLGSMAWMFSMHADTVDVEKDSQVNDTAFTQKMRQDQRTARRPHTPPSEELIAKTLHEKSRNRNDSVVGLQGDIFETPDCAGQVMPGIFPNLASRLDLPGVNTTSGAPPSPAEEDFKFGFEFENHTTETAHSPAKKAGATNIVNDPTMDFSTLLIAKPNPFKFNLKIRDQDKADRIVRRWIELKMDGEFEDSRVYWKDGNKGDQQHGWGEVFT